MIDIRNPITWPMFPVLPVVRIGGNPVYNDKDVGIVMATRQMQAVPIVFLVNLCDVGGRSLDSIVNDLNIERETFENMAALAEKWNVD